MTLKREAKHRVRSFLYRRPVILPVFHYFCGNEWSRYCDKNTDICIEGYPSSANTFVYNIFEEVYNGKVISHHTHSIANLKRAINYSIPTIVLCRHPKEAVASRCIRFGIGQREALLQYAEFYEYVIKIKERVLVSNFEHSTERINILLKDFENFSGMNSNFDKNIGKMKDKVINKIQRWSKKHGQSKSAPDDSRDEIKEVLEKKVSEKKEYKRCKKIYSKVVSGSVGR